MRWSVGFAIHRALHLLAPFCCTHNLLLIQKHWININTAVMKHLAAITLVLSIIHASMAIDNGHRELLRSKLIAATENDRKLGKSKGGKKGGSKSSKASAKSSKASRRSSKSSKASSRSRSNGSKPVTQSTAFRAPTPSPAPTNVVDNLLPIPSPTPPATPAPTFPCNLTPQERAAKLREMALKITPAVTLDNVNSPQSKALRWLSFDDAMYLCPNDAEVNQRYIMSAFYFATGGGNWKECNAPTGSSQSEIDAANRKCTIVATKYPVKPVRSLGTDAWLTPTSVCSWGGLACHGDEKRKGTLDQIDIENNGLSGSLIDEIGSLENLRFFILEQGKIGGNIPETIGNLPLMIVDLDYNELDGPIPQSLYNVKTLQQLDLNDNQMTGTLSANVANWEKMTFLQLDNNSFGGNIPPQLGSLDRLSNAFFNGNNFVGSMPQRVCALETLQALTADCAGDKPKIDCDCCTACFPLPTTRN
jgi:hypothetical protein